MSAMLALHAIAKARGDGLHPALLAVLERRHAILSAGPAVEDIAQRRADAHIQAGPYPSGSPADRLPPEVVLFKPLPKPAPRVRTASS
jgi:hypothetical protein